MFSLTECLTTVALINTQVFFPHALAKLNLKERNPKCRQVILAEQNIVFNYRFCLKLCLHKLVKFVA